MIAQAPPSQEAIFRSAVAYIVSEFISRQPTKPPRILYKKDIFQVKIAEIIRGFCRWTRAHRILSMLELMKLAKELHLSEVSMHDSLLRTAEIERRLLAVVIYGLGGNSQGASPNGNTHVEENAATQTSIFLSERGGRIEAVIKEMKQVILDGSRADRGVPDLALVEETYAGLGGDSNTGIGGIEVFKEIMSESMCFFRLVRIASDTCIKGWLQAK